MNGTKGVFHPNYIHGLRAGYTDYRYGQDKPKNKKCPPIFRGQKRSHVVTKVMDNLRDWRCSPFEGEGATIEGIRSACLEGYDWHRSNAEAVALVAEAFRILGAVRPTWEQGQREYSIPVEYCNWCYSPMPEGIRARFCTVECAHAAIQHRNHHDSYRRSSIGASAYYIIKRNEQPARACKHCGAPFHPSSRDTVFCSHKCRGLHETATPPRDCERCGKTFRPRNPYGAGRFCSIRCYAATEKPRDHKCTCEWCSKAFMAVIPDARFCSKGCNEQQRQIRTGRWQPKRISPPVFDYVFRPMAA